MTDRFMQNQNGFTLMEVMVASVIYGIVALLAAGLMVDAARFSTNMQRENTRAGILQQVVSAVRSPAAIEASLGPLMAGAGSGQGIDCLIDPTQACTATPALTQFNLGLVANRAAVANGTTITSGGAGYYTDSGQPCAPATYKDGSQCPLRVTTGYAVMCPSQPGSPARTTCPSSQAAVTINYTIQPNTGWPVPPRQDQYFAPIQGVQYFKVSALYSAVDSAGVTGPDARNLTTQDRSLASSLVVAKQCPPGQLMTGLDTAGTAKCVSVQESCPRGSVFTGFTNDGAGNFSVKCVDTKCPAGQIFNGLTASGTPNCVPLNPSNQSCNPFNGAAMNTGYTQFMTGINSTASPTCSKLTCQPGEITACWINGNAQCVTTSFIPQCPLGTCSAPPTASPPTPGPPGTGPWYDSTTPVTAPYNGIPFISKWHNGEPVEGYHMTYRDQSAVSTSSVLNGLFYDPLTSSTADLDGGKCYFEPGNGNRTVIHTWYIDGTALRHDAPCPAILGTLQPGIDCGLPPPNATMSYGRIQQTDNTCIVTTWEAGGFAFAGGCAVGFAGNSPTCYSNSQSFTNTPTCDRWSFTIRPSCNYRYKKPAPVCP